MSRKPGKKENIQNTNVREVIQIPKKKNKLAEWSSNNENFLNSAEYMEYSLGRKEFIYSELPRPLDKDVSSSASRYPPFEEPTGIFPGVSKAANPSARFYEQVGPRYDDERYSSRYANDRQDGYLTNRYSMGEGGFANEKYGSKGIPLGRGMKYGSDSYIRDEGFAFSRNVPDKYPAGDGRMDVPSPFSDACPGGTLPEGCPAERYGDGCLPGRHSADGCPMDRYGDGCPSGRFTPDPAGRYSADPYATNLNHNEYSNLKNEDPFLSGFFKVNDSSSPKYMIIEAVGKISRIMEKMSDYLHEVSSNLSNKSGYSNGILEIKRKLEKIRKNGKAQINEESVDDRLFYNDCELEYRRSFEGRKQFSYYKNAYHAFLETNKNLVAVKNLARIVKTTENNKSNSSVKEDNP